MSRATLPVPSSRGRRGSGWVRPFVVVVTALATFLAATAAVGSPAPAGAAPAGSPAEVGGGGAPVAAPAPDPAPDEHALRIIRSEPAWVFLEAPAREAVAELHGVPNDANLLIWGRAEVTSAIYGMLLDIVEKEPSERTPQEQAAYAALAQRLYAAEVTAAERALAELDRWQADPCRYMPAHGLPYSRHLACNRLGQAYSSPRPPSSGQLIVSGAVEAYDWMFQPGVGPAHDAAARSLAHLSVLLSGPVIGALVGTGLFAAGTATSFYTAIAPFATAVDWAVKSATGVVPATVQPSLVGVGVAGGAFSAAVVVTAIVIGVLEVLEVIEAAQVRPTLQENLDRAENFPNLSLILRDTAGGAARMFTPFFQSTLDQGRNVPDIPRPVVPWEPGVADHRYVTSSLSMGTLEFSSFATVGLDGGFQESYEDLDGYLVTRRGGAPFRSLTLPFYDVAGVAEGRPFGGIAQLGMLPEGYSVAPDPTDRHEHRCQDDHPRCLTGESFTAFARGEARTITRLPNRPPSAPLVTVERTTSDEGAPTVLKAFSHDAEGSALRYSWTVERPECRDCLLVEEPGFDTFEGASVPHVFTDDGEFTIEVTATDRGGASATTTTTVVVANVAPTVEVTTSEPAETGVITGIEGVWRDAGTNDSHTVEVDWGDGTVESFSHPTRALYPRATDRADGSRRFTARHTYQAGGTYQAVVRVTDDEGAAGSRTAPIEVVAPEPPPPGAVVPDPPRGVLAWRTADGGRGVDMVPPADGGAPILRYEVTQHDTYYLIDGMYRYEWPEPGMLTSSTRLVVPPGPWVPDPAQLKVRAVNAVGPGPWSTLAMPAAEDGVDELVRPDARIAGPDAVDEGASVELGLASTGVVPGRQIVSTEWDIGGDGTVEGTDDSFTFAAGRPGLVRVALTVTDDAGWSRTIVHDITVRNVAPVISGLPSSLTAGADRQVELSGVVDDASGPVRVDVSWGDGQVGSTAGPGPFSFAHTYASGGALTVTVVATDDDGGVTVATVPVVVPGVPSPPSVAWVEGGPASVSAVWAPSSSGNASHYRVVIRDVSHEGEVGEVVHTATTTDETYYAWFDPLPLHDYEVTVEACSAEGCAAAEARRVTTHQAHILVRGTVRETDGEPAPGVTVYAYAEGGGTAVDAGWTDGEGRFEMYVLAPAAVQLVVVPQSHRTDLALTWHGGDRRATSTTVGVVGPHEHPAFDLTVGRSVTVSGSVVDEDGPVAGAQVTAFSEHDTWVGTGSAYVADGTFTLAGLPEGEYRLLVQRRPGSPGTWMGGGGRDDAPVVTVGDEPVTDLVMELGRQAEVSGTVEGGGGTPGGITVQLFTRGTNWVPRAQTTTAADGGFRFVDVPVGEYEVRVGGGAARPEVPWAWYRAGEVATATRSAGTILDLAQVDGAPIRVRLGA